MAHIENAYCRHCAQHRNHTNGKCDECRERGRRAAMAEWLSMTSEEQRLDLHKRLLKLEAGPARY